MSPSPRARRRDHRRPVGRPRRGDELSQRAAAGRLDPEVRRGLIVEATERLLAEHDPLLVTFEQVAEAAGVSRPLVHAYLGDRRGLVDAVQVRIIARLDTWVGHGLGRARTTDDRLRALVHATMAFVAEEANAWGVLGATGGFDHPGLHALRHRWTVVLSIDDDPDDLGAQTVVSALVAGVGTWAPRGVDAGNLVDRLQPLLLPR